MSATSDGPGADRHLGEYAELYALGVLEPEERSHVEAHVAGCAMCARSLGAAETTVAALDDACIESREPSARLGARIAASARAATPPLPLARRRGWPAESLVALAASLLLAFGLGGAALVERSADARHAASESAILSTIATSHFLHVPLNARVAGAPVSKAIYARDGDWLYVVIDSAACDCHVVTRSGAVAHDLGPPDARGTASTLFTRSAGHPGAVALVDASGHVIAETDLVYSAN